MQSGEEFFHTSFTDNDHLWMTSSYTLRKTVGILGMSMPLLLYISLYIDAGLPQPLESISHYYYTRASGVFVAVLSTLAIFLMIYKGKSVVDLLVSLVAGVAALMVVFFPTDNLAPACCDLTKRYAVTYLKDSDSRTLFHYISAGVFLGCLAYMSFFLFTRSDKPRHLRSPEKVLRNRIYRVCGVLMVLAMALMFFGGFLEWIPEDRYSGNKLTFWMETVAVEAFGFSWLVKGETLFRDRQRPVSLKAT